MTVEAKSIREGKISKEDLEVVIANFSFADWTVISGYYKEKGELREIVIVNGDTYYFDQGINVSISGKSGVTINNKPLMSCTQALFTRQILEPTKKKLSDQILANEADTSLLFSP